MPSIPSLLSGTLPVVLCVAVLATGCGGSGTEAPDPALTTTAGPLQAQVLEVGDSALFEGSARSAYTDAELSYAWTVRRLQSDRPYVPTPIYDTEQYAGKSLAFQVQRAASWEVTLTITDPGGATTTATTRLVGRHRFIDNLDGSATNVLSGLTWQLQDDGNRYTLAEARGRPVLSAGDNHGLDVCGNLVRAGHDDWRVPTLQEVGTLLDFSHENFPVVAAFAPSTRASSFYVSDSWVPNSKVDFIGTGDGLIAHLDATERTYLRCVRP
jgi:hypothetical protein